MTRIGHLMPDVGGGDYWWVITAENTSPVTDALDAVLTHGVPWLLSQLRR